MTSGLPVAHLENGGKIPETNVLFSRHYVARPFHFSSVDVVNAIHEVPETNKKIRIPLDSIF